MLVALEGIDGSGKGTQARLLEARAIESGLRAARISFPQYGDNAFAKMVGEYLNGAFGAVDEVHPKLSSLLFAGDRFASKARLIEAIASNDLVVLDRYVASNLAHQAAKLPISERKAFIAWLFEIEFVIYGLPRPDLTIYLDVPVQSAQALVGQKPARDASAGDYTSLKADIHEKDESYLAACKEAYADLVEHDIAGPWKVIGCLEGDRRILRPQEEILGEIWGLLAAAGVSMPSRIEREANSA